MGLLCNKITIAMILNQPITDMTYHWDNASAKGLTALDSKT
ncbi:hypothetical protein [Limnohabitans sp. 2KL-17]|nr:hypothetical protein [Limnohabitans sp. 2KL-17]